MQTATNPTAQSPTECSLIKQELKFDAANYIDEFVNSIVKDVSKEELILKYECKILPYKDSGFGLELFRCPICNDDDIHGRKELTEHLHNHQTMHRPCEGRHLCCLCGKELSSNSSLERHLLTHSNHRPYNCAICNKKFTTNGNLSRHMKASHSFESDPLLKPDLLTPLSVEVDKISGGFCDSASQQQQLPLPAMKHLHLPLPPAQPFLPMPLDLMNLSFSETPKSIFMKILESSFGHLKPLPFISNEVLNLSTKTGHLKPSAWTNQILNQKSEPDPLPLPTKPPKSRKEPKKRKQSQLLLSEDAPLDLSFTKPPLSSPVKLEKKNSFLLTSLCSIDPIDTESSGFKVKKNSYKDAPKLIRCPVIGCSQKFPWNSSLMRHILTHTAHKPFKCIRCTKCFSTKSNRERHMHRVHGIHVSAVVRSGSPTATSGDHSESVHSDSGCSNVSAATVAPPVGNYFLSQKEWIEMSSSDRRAEDISHTLLRQAGQPIVEPNPLRLPIKP